MSKIKWTSLALLFLVILDASGDAFRGNGWQLVHHFMESIQISIWILVWILFRFNPVFIVMYILGRVWLFDPVLNLWVGNPTHLLYMGENDIFGKSVRWFADLVKQNYLHFSFMLKFIALIWWVTWFWTNKQFKEFKFM